MFYRIEQRTIFSAKKKTKKKREVDRCVWVITVPKAPERGSLQIFGVLCSETTTQAFLRFDSHHGSDLASKVRLYPPEVPDDCFWLSHRTENSFAKSLQAGHAHDAMLSTAAASSSAAR